MPGLHNIRLFAATVLLGLLGACTTSGTRPFLTAPGADLPPRAELETVTFFKQDEHQCGPAALAMALQHAGIAASPEQLQPFLYVPDKQGSLQPEMLATARRQGALALPLEPKLETILQEVAAGNPVLVLQNLAFSWYPVWHYAVVIGYDLPQEQLILRSGLEKRLHTSFEEFERTWAPSAHWAITVLPPERIPHTAQAEPYVRGLLALAHSNPELNLREAYTKSLQRWPDSLPLQIAAANFWYQRRDLEQARSLLEHASQMHPDAVIAWNNLAQVLSELGKTDAALLAARRAVALGGPLNAQARQTLSEIEQHTAPEAARRR